jgi:hypothetical protein
MARQSKVAIVVVLAGALAVVGCWRMQEVGPGYGADGDADSDGDTDTDADSDSDIPWESLYEAVDILVVVDTSYSMIEEHVILSTASFTLINGLIHPLPTSNLPGGLDDLRVAVVSADMGLSWGGNPYVFGDGWPGGDPPPNCDDLGDNGGFKSYSEQKTIGVKDGQIPCDASDVQCPPGWQCEDFDDDDVGRCSTSGSQQVDCPAIAGDYAQTPLPSDVPNPEMAVQVACLTSLGTSGCGFEQPLQSMAVGLAKPAQAEFVRPEAMLAVIVVSDEDDCSIATNELFAVPEIQNTSAHQNNLACGSYPEHLYTPQSYREALVDGIKDGNDDAVLFAAIAGVPPVAECEGRGDEIDECLDHEAMQLVPEQIDGTWFWVPTCTREEDDVEVTRAWPGRRFVELAQQFGARGYVYSICNADWSPAMSELAAMIPLKSDD